jgi:hypothetical protein
MMDFQPSSSDSDMNCCGISGAAMVNVGVNTLQGLLLASCRGISMLRANVWSRELIPIPGIHPMNHNNRASMTLHRFRRADIGPLSEHSHDTPAR